MRWMAVATYAKEISQGDKARERRFLQLYFFKEHIGRGMPEVKCTAAALQIASMDPLAPPPEMRATVQNDDTFDLQLQMRSMQLQPWQQSWPGGMHAAAQHSMFGPHAAFAGYAQQMGQPLGVMARMLGSAHEPCSCTASVESRSWHGIHAVSRGEQDGGRCL